MSISRVAQHPVRQRRCTHSDCCCLASKLVRMLLCYCRTPELVLVTPSLKPQIDVGCHDFFLHEYPYLHSKEAMQTGSLHDF